MNGYFDGFLGHSRMKSVSSMLSRRRGLRVKPVWICNSCQRNCYSSFPSAAATNKPRAARDLPTGPARTRFAPSPTGYLHLGSLRTALFNFLLAKATGGQFILRIEDTDQKRTIPDAEDRLCQDLQWAGLEWDEGPKKGGPYGPYKQSQRTATYRHHAESLLESGHAYRCFCSAESLHTLAKHRTSLGLPAEYDRTCASVSVGESAARAAKGEAHVIRFKVPPTYPEFNDLVYKKVRNRTPRGNEAALYPAFDDPILLKSDGFPTYHLANVVDDHEMNITHVVRGAEWMSSTPKHLAIYEALSWEPPAFAHVGLLMDENHQKLSKRNLDIDIAAFRDKMDIFPETLTNFVALLGWSHSQKKDVMGIEQLIENFSMKFTTGNTIVTYDKLWFLQKAHAGRYAAASPAGLGSPYMSLMIDPIMKILKERELLGDSELILNMHEPKTYIINLLRADARNYTTAREFVDRNGYFFDRPDEVDLEDANPSLELTVEELKKVVAFLMTIPECNWTRITIRDTIDALVAGGKSEGHSLKLPAGSFGPKIIHSFLRWALSAGKPGPSGVETMEILGRSEVLCRLYAAVSLLENLGADGSHESEDGEN